MLVSKDGKVLVSSPINHRCDLSGRDLRRGDFRQITSEGLYCAGANLREADFFGCDLYWLDLYEADCTAACFQRAKLKGANFKSTCLLGADFSYAIITHDNLDRPSTFAHSNLEGANFEGALLVGTEYDDETVFPADFDPIRNGMVLNNRAHDSLVEPPCKEKK